MMWRPTWPICWRGPRRARAASIRGAPPTCARCAAAWVHRKRAAVRARRGAHARHLGLRDGLARGQEEQRLQGAAADALRGGDHHASGRRGQGGGPRHVALRRAARRVRAGRPRPAHRRAVRRAARLPAGLLRPRHGAPEARAGAPLPLDGPFPVAAQRKLGVETDPPHRLRFHPRPARRLGASLHRRHGRRRAHHHALRRGRLRARPDGRAARDRPCALRGRPAARLAAPAGRQCARHGAAREPVAADGDAGLPQRRLPRLRSPAHARRLRQERTRPGRPTTSIVSIRASRRASSASTPTR